MFPSYPLPFSRSSKGESACAEQSQANRAIAAWTPSPAPSLSFEESAMASVRSPALPDGVTVFLKQMARYPLLSAREEIELARYIQQFSQIENCQHQLHAVLGRQPNPSELAEPLALSEPQLEAQWQRGQWAKQRMVCSNLRLVVMIAKRYVNRGVPFLDLLQEGTIGLHRATEKFDPDLGYRFSTYACWWIRQGVTRAIAYDARTIRIPMHVFEQLTHFKRCARQLRQDLKREPTQAELAKDLKISNEQLQLLLRARQRVMSLNEHVGIEDDTELLELLEAETGPSPEEHTESQILAQELSAVLKRVLTAREQEVIVLRFGLNQQLPHTLEEVSQLFKVSRERVRQIQGKAMRKLRGSVNVRSLRIWLQ